jgi:hypothetical protein
MIDDVIETYRCLLSCCKKMPGMRLEDAFSDKAIRSIEKEFAWLQNIKSEGTLETPQ